VSYTSNTLDQDSRRIRASSRAVKSTFHRFSKSQQDALLPSVLDGILTLVGATTENPFFESTARLRSRSTLFRLEPLDRQALRTLLDRGLDAEGSTLEDDAADAIIDSVDRDGRALLTTLEVALAVAGEGQHVTLDDVEPARTTRALTWSRDDHYDIISAFIKSIRGGDPDAGLHWLARMIVAGEDPRYIARRLVVLASEDIGMADPTSLLIATAAANAMDYVGLPEAQLNLPQAVVHLATAPESNRTALGIWKAIEDARCRPAGRVPPHLRDAHYRSAERIGHGVGYRHPHDDREGGSNRTTLPDELADTRYYEPSDHGGEAHVGERIRRLGDDQGPVVGSRSGAADRHRLTRVSRGRHADFRGSTNRRRRSVKLLNNTTHREGDQW
jgi:putative ATPase